MINREFGLLEQNSYEERNFLEILDFVMGKDFFGFFLLWCMFLRLIFVLFVFKLCSLFVGKYIYFCVFVVNIQYLLSINFQKWYGFNIDQLMYGFCICNVYLCLVYIIFVEYIFVFNFMQRLYIVLGYYQRIFEFCSFVLIFRSCFVLIFDRS